MIMATFAFSGRTRTGENVSGERIGDTMDAVVAALRREQIQVTKIQPTQAKAGSGAAGGARKLKARGVPAKNLAVFTRDRKSTRLNSSHSSISYAVFCLKK